MKARISVRTDKDGKTWYVARRRIWLFFWTEYFPCLYGECVQETCKSTNMHDVVEFILRRRTHKQKCSDAWDDKLKDAHDDT